MTTENRTGHWMQTFSGRKYYPYDPRPEDFHIEDIAHSLSMLCRYNGHSKYFLSVAQHSVLMSQYVSEENALWALMHDAAEAYVGDMIRPMKCGGQMGADFQALEADTLITIAKRFNLPWPIPDEIHEADNRMLATESRDLLGGQIEPWSLDGAKPYDDIIISWRPLQANDTFLAVYHELTKRKGV